MKLLAIDTSSTACSIALAVDDTVTLLHKDAPMQQAQLILPLLDEFMHANNIKLNQLDAIVFGCGPGSFTGIRIAISVAQGLGYALQIPLIPISSLAALAQAAYLKHGWKKIVAVFDARMNEVYCGKYTVNNGLVELIGEEKVIDPDKISVEKDFYGVGFVEALSQSFIEKDITLTPSAAAMLQLATPRYLARDWVSPENALPVYLRDTVAMKSQF